MLQARLFLGCMIMYPCLWKSLDVWLSTDCHGCWSVTHITYEDYLNQLIPNRCLSSFYRNLIVCDWWLITLGYPLEATWFSRWSHTQWLFDHFNRHLIQCELFLIDIWCFIQSFNLNERLTIAHSMLSYSSSTYHFMIIALCNPVENTVTDQCQCLYVGKPSINPMWIFDRFVWECCYPVHLWKCVVQLRSWVTPSCTRIRNIMLIHHSIPTNSCITGQ